MGKLKIIEDLENSFSLLKYYIWKLQKENKYLKNELNNIRNILNEVIKNNKE